MATQRVISDGNLMGIQLNPNSSWSTLKEPQEDILSNKESTLMFLYQFHPIQLLRETPLTPSHYRKQNQEVLRCIHHE